MVNMWVPVVYLLCLLSRTVIRDGLCFNLDVVKPFYAEGQRNSYFGFSVALHQSVDGRSQNSSTLLVGAPLGANLQPQTTRSGAVFRCDVFPLVRPCTQITTDGFLLNSPVLQPPLATEDKEDQWMGVTVRSAGPGKKAMVCAHRYVKRDADETYRWGQGLCYTYSQSLAWENAWEPCAGEPTYRGHQDYGFCQAGTSGLVLEDEMVLIGAPGPYTWRGTVFAKNVSTNYFDRDSTKYSIPVQREDIVDFYSYLGFSVTQGTFLSPGQRTLAAGAPRSNGTGEVFLIRRIREQADLEVQFSYKGEQFASSFGYEIASADVNGDGMSDLLVGAPFFHGDGQGGRVYVYLSDGIRGISESTLPKTLTGRKLEGRFGFSIAAAGDLNRDGFEDVVIGAPTHGHGHVFVFLGGRGGLREEPSQVVTGESFPPRIINSFGHSLSAGVDVDQNGYPDVLVGAYKTDAVVLLRARPIIRVETKIETIDSIENIDPQRRGCKLHPEYRGICFSFKPCFRSSSQLPDKPLNYYVEITDQRRGRALVVNNGTRTLNLRFTPRNQWVCAATEETVQVKETNTDIQFPIRMKLVYRLDYIEEPQLVTYLSDLSGYPVLDKGGAEKEFQATFKKNCSQEVCRAKLNLSASLSLTQNRTQNVYLLRYSPRDAAGAVSGTDEYIDIRVDVTSDAEPAYLTNLYVEYPAGLFFVKHFGDIRYAENDLREQRLLQLTLGNPLDRPISNLTLRFQANEDIEKEKAFDIRVFLNTSSTNLGSVTDHNFVVRVVKVANLDLRGTVRPDFVRYKNKQIGETGIEFLDEIGSQVTHVYQLTNDGPLQARNIMVRIEWPHQMFNERGDGKWLLYLTRRPETQGGGECVVPSHQVNYLSFKERGNATQGIDGATVRPVGPSDGKSTPHSPAANEIPRGKDKVPEEDSWTYQQRGSSRESEEGSRSVVSSRTSSSSSSTSYSSSSVYRTVQEREREGGRRRRGAGVRPEPERTSSGERVVTLSCTDGATKCITIECTFPSLLKGGYALISIHARLWDGSLSSEYPTVDKVHLRSNARIVLEESSDLVQDDVENDYCELTTLAFPDISDKESEPVATWIIVLSVLAGLLILCLIVYALYKMNFFKRKRPMTEGKPANYRKPSL